MNAEGLTRQTIRLVQRENRKRGIVLTKEDVLRLKVQTVDPWKRAFVALMGVGFVILAFVLYAAGAPWWGAALFAVGGLAVVILGILGKKKHLDAELRQLPTRVADGVLNGVFDALI